MSEQPAPLIETQPDVILVRVQAQRLDDESTRRLHADVLAAAAQAAHLPLIIDLSRVDFMPSLSLAAMVRLATDFRSRQQRLMLAALHSDVRKLFVLTRLDRLMELHDDVEAALRTVRVR